MIESKAQVLWYQRGRAAVQAEQQSACAHCSSAEGCGSSVLNKALGQRHHTIEIACDSPLKPGQWVLIGVPERGLVLASMITYMLPLFGLIVGAVGGQLLATQLLLGEVVSIVGGALGLGAGLLGVRVLSRQRGQQTLQPQLLRQLGDMVPVNTPCTDTSLRDHD